MNGGTFPRVNACPETLCTVPVVRVKRKRTLSVVMAWSPAAAVPVAAVTCTITSCPSTKSASLENNVVTLLGGSDALLKNSSVSTMKSGLLSVTRNVSPTLADDSVLVSRGHHFVGDHQEKLPGHAVGEQRSLHLILWRGIQQIRRNQRQRSVSIHCGIYANHRLIATRHVAFNAEHRPLCV